MLSRRRGGGGDEEGGRRMVSRAACAFVSPVVVLLLYVLGRPIYWSLSAKVGFTPSVLSAHDAGVHTAVDAVQSARGVPAPLLLRASERASDDGADEPQALEVPRTPKPFDAADYVLTPELVRRRTLHNIILVTWANDHYFDFVMNWVTNLQRVNVTNYMVGAMDDDLLHRLIAEDVPTWSMQSGLTVKDFGWGTATFHKMGRSKIDLIHKFVSMGFDILVSDVDTAWMRDPLPFLLRYPDADILTSSDHLSNTVDDDGLERFNLGLGAANIGVMFVRKAALELVDEWNKILDKDEKVWDQNAFNDLFRRGTGQELPNRLFMAFDGKLKMGILPVATFASGHTFFVQRMHEKVQLQPYVVHATFQFSGTDGKRHRLREALLWDVDPPEYYDPPGGFLVFRPDVPRSLLDGSNSKDGHFALVNHQIKQVRDALALAQVLGRVIIMPKLYCGWDRWWAPHHGRIPNSKLDLPYLCPMDHVFDPEVWARSKPAAEFGPDIGFREYSLLSNARMPTAVLESTVTVAVCTANRPCDAEARPAAAGALQMNLTTAITDADAKAIFSPLSGIKVLQFTSMLDVFSGFAQKEDEERFHRRVKDYAGIWCCIHAHPGHIWYDLLFDKPHVDRHNRHFNGTHFPLLTGP